MVRPVPVVPPASAEEIRDANARYHDLAAQRYDDKWGIDFGALGQSQVGAKLGKALGDAPPRYRDSLEVGAGTGYFTLNLLRSGLIERATCSDISPGMLQTLAANAARLRLDVSTQAADAEQLPFDDGSFDLVFGHAVLHHIPDLPRAFAEFSRVLRPGGTVVFAGEPSRYGDRLASAPKAIGRALAPLWRRAVRAAPAPKGAPAEPPPGSDGARLSSEAALEGVVDVHAFSPGELVSLARAAGFGDVRVSGEELLANWFGWVNRTLETSADPDDVPWAWRLYAHRGYLLLQTLDSRLLESHLPVGAFYNLMLAARKPAASPPGQRGTGRPARRGASRT
jgi:ubiquinone/menaquinone biosynthesis C-methylase UbiE